MISGLPSKTLCLCCCKEAVEWRPPVILYIIHVSAELKGKVVPVCAMKAYWVRKSVVPLVLNLSTRWRWGINFMPRPLYPQERTLVATQLKAVETRETFWTVFDKRNLLPLLGFEPWTVQAIASHYMDCDVSAPICWERNILYHRNEYFCLLL